MGNDPENGAVVASYIKGFPSLAAFIASDQEHGTLLYKRFDRLGARNILYLQSELAELERRQDELDKDDLLDDDIAPKKAARDWKAFQAAAAVAGSKADERLKLVKEVRERIKEYREAILLDSAILSLRRPSRQTWEAFRNHYMNVDPGGDEFPTLGGSSATLYDDRQDLVALGRLPEEDRLSKFLRKHCSLFFLERNLGGGSHLAYISASRISVFVSVANVLLAAILLFGAIYNLFYVKTDQVKLGLIAGYTTFFALCITLVTNAKRSEVFAACAAYAGVLVVFVSGDLGGSLTIKQLHSVLDSLESLVHKLKIPGT